MVGLRGKALSKRLGISPSRTMILSAYLFCITKYSIVLDRNLTWVFNHADNVVIIKVLEKKQCCETYEMTLRV